MKIEMLKMLKNQVSSLIFIKEEDKKECGVDLLNPKGKAKLQFPFFKKAKPQWGPIIRVKL